MDNTYSFNATLLNFVFPTVNEAPAVTEALPLTFHLAAGTVPYPVTQVVPLTGLTNPIILIVKGAPGITVTLGDEADSHPANPLFVVSDKTGMALTEITITNSGAACTVTVLAAE